MPQALRRRLAPRIDPVTDLLLDLYTVATGVARVGYHVVCTLPQYVPPDGVLHPTWRAETDWQATAEAHQHLPMTMVRDTKGQARVVAVWRPAPSDHPSQPQHFTRAHVFARFARTLRMAAERITEGLLLLQDGVAPEVAFPPGRVEKIGRKVCPFCPYAHAVCFVTQQYETAEERAELETTATERRETRAKLCAEHTAIAERHTLWADVRAKLDARHAQSMWG